VNSRELLNDYVRLLTTWNKKINLVQRADVPIVMERHIRDCEQICQYINKEDIVIDVGSGAGLPGVVLSIQKFRHVILCEKSHKKSVFLREVRSKLGLNFMIYNGDVYDFSLRKFIAHGKTISNVELCNASKKCTLVSRAFGSIAKLSDVMCKIGVENGIFHKGRRCMEEISLAKNFFEFDYDIKPSATSRDGAVVHLSCCRRR
jgi:16S rRNA (guanine(527)-N(7))-methyltransferase RsmG